jgi:hypothetical protein
MQITLMKKIVSIWVSALSLLLFTQCGPQTPAFTKKPIDDIVRNLSDVQNYTILLHDMNFDDKKEQYLHQYRILKQPNGQDTLLEETTAWQQVPDTYFNEHVDNMGMALVTKVNGVVDKKIAPPGYNNYVGNEKYGSWQQGSGGNSFWAFYGQYAFMRSMFGYGYGSIYRGGYNDYRRNYAPSGRAYYGKSGSGNTFGTSGTHTANRGNRSTWASRSGSFKQNVRSRVSRSASRTSRSNSRSSSRYRSNSSTRSRGFGGGK